MSIQLEPRFLAMDNIIRGNADMIPKGTTVGLRELDGCDTGYLLERGIIREFTGSGRKASMLLLRKDKPSEEEFLAEVQRLQDALEVLEEENEQLRRNRPTAPPSKLPADLHVMAERIAELEESERSLKASLKTATEGRAAAQERCDKYAAIISGKKEEPKTPAAPEPVDFAAGQGILGEDFGRPAPPVRGAVHGADIPATLSEHREQGMEPVGTISERYKQSQALEASLAALTVESRTTTDPLANDSAGAIVAKTPAGIRTTTTPLK